MGLQGGDAGAKATFRALFQSAHSRVEKLPDVRTVHKRRRSETLVVVDGNVLLMAVPVAIDTFDSFVAVIATQIASAVKAAAHVVVVFDEPKEMTKAKVATQKKRDRSNTRKAPVCSSDLAPCPTTDAYTLTDLKGVLVEDAGPDAAVVYRDGNKMYAQAPVNVQLLMGNRAARSRFHDAVAQGVLDYIQENIDGNGMWSLTFDGIDARGASRPSDEARVPGVLSSDPDLWTPLLARERAVGEGDMKLTDVTNRVHDHAVANPDGPLGMVSLNLLWTIDTDSLLIELLQEAFRVGRDGPATATSPFQLAPAAASSSSQKRKAPDATPYSSVSTDNRPFKKQRALSALLQKYVGESGETAWCSCSPPRPMPIGTRCNSCATYAFAKVDEPPAESETEPPVAETEPPPPEEEEEEEEPAGRKREETILCLREPARKRTANHPARPSSFACVDMAKLYHSVQRYMHGGGYARSVPMALQYRTTQLFTLGVLMCKSDFVEVKGATVKSMVPEVREMIRSEPESLAELDNVVSGSTAPTLRAALVAERLINNYLGTASGVGRRFLLGQQDFFQVQMKQATWTLAYWSGHEFKNVHDFGFASYQSADLAAGVV